MGGGGGGGGMEWNEWNMNGMNGMILMEWNGMELDIYPAVVLPTLLQKFSLLRFTQNGIINFCYLSGDILPNLR